MPRQPPTKRATRVSGADRPWQKSRAPHRPRTPIPWYSSAAARGGAGRSAASVLQKSRAGTHAHVGLVGEEAVNAGAQVGEQLALQVTRPRGRRAAAVVQRQEF